ncbi:MAG TPA: 2-dehydropantoate 2-reductase [Chthoniobacteraceae bacterium]|nr:2-dehydropantoate 2-reductase [Chthoniobacteraceae bacterium]
MSFEAFENGYKVAVVGSGAVGCYYGAMLAHHGGNVHFLMRRDLEAVRKNGLQIRSPGGDFHLTNVNARGSTSEIGPCDLVLIALKTTANKALEELIPPLLKENTALLTLQNGFGNEDFLAERFGRERVMGGLCFVCLNRTAPGVVEHFGYGALSIGEMDRPSQPRTKRVVDDFNATGIHTRAVENLGTERWRKLVWNVPFNGLTIAAGGITTDLVVGDEGLQLLSRNLMAEVIGAAAKEGHVIPHEFIEEQIARTVKMGAYKPSSLIDYWEGREVEVESIWGEPYRRGLRSGAQVGRLEALYFLLKKLTAQK